MDKAILLGVSLVALTFVLGFILSIITQVDHSFFVGQRGLYNVLISVIFASFPIGALIILIRIMQWAKFQFHKGTLFGLFLIGAGVTAFDAGLYDFGLIYHVFFNYYVRLAALAGIFVGILILTIKTAIWGSKYIEEPSSKNCEPQV